MPSSTRPQSRRRRAPDPSMAEQLSEEARAQARRLARENELHRSHWLVFMCPRGHVVEHHRQNVPGDTVRCVICGDMATRETPAGTVAREERAAADPLALAQRLAETLADWAIAHLDAASWTRRSEQQRQERARRARSQAGGAPSVFDHL